MNNKIEQGFKPRKWLLVILIIVGLAITVVLISKVVDDAKNNRGIFANISNKNNVFSDAEERRKKSEEESKKSSFNIKFEPNAGSTTGFFLEDLLDDVITSNKTNQEHKITVVYNELSTQDESEIRKINDDFEATTNCDVSLEYDENGYVNKIKIEKKITKEDIKKFNSTFETNSGTQWGSSVVRLIDNIITNNKTNKDNIISISYKDVTTQDEEEMRKLKQNFATFTDYEVILDYDEIGFVNKVTIR